MAFHLETSLPEELVIGRGTIQVLEGTITKGVTLSIEVSGERGQVPQSIEFFPNSDEIVTFHARMKWTPDWVGKQTELVATLDKNKDIVLGRQKIIANKSMPIESINLPGDAPMIAICMATYNPSSDAFRRQIETILMQSHKNWMLLVVDDGSSPKALSKMHTICGADQQRVRLMPHNKNVGFYHNFERALSYVPDNAEYIALADQDDLWYPDKLEKLLEATRLQQAVLAYSDMRIVQESGEVVSKTYWRGRKNEYEDMKTVFLANTVTGAACLFKRELLAPLLPFPTRIGDAFHDHWLALTAMQAGRLAYVNQPLYDYYQYGDSVIGHCDFVRWSVSARIKSALKMALRVFTPRQSKLWLGQKIGAGIAIYRGECLRLSLFSDTLKLRFNVEQGLPKQHALNLMQGGFISFYRLMRAHLAIISTGKTTDDAEFRLSLAYLAREYQRRKS